MVVEEEEEEESPLVFHIKDAEFENVRIHALPGHGPKSSGAQHKISVIALIQISYDHFGPLFIANLGVLASYLQMGGRFITRNIILYHHQ